MITSNLGFPRIGAHRELKFAVERFWSGAWNNQQLLAASRELREKHWRMQAEAGIEHIPSNDFSLYDHVLDAAVMVGAIPKRFASAGPDLLTMLFAMARGTRNAPAMEMTKWFDTNYHYIVPEFEAGMEFHPNSGKPVAEFLEARAHGIVTRPVLLGPVSLARLGKIHVGREDRTSIVARLVPVYEQVLADLATAGAQWVQMDEPCFALDLDPSERALYMRVYDRLGASGPKMMLATYFSGLRDNLQTALKLPVSALHLDLVRAPEQLSGALRSVPDRMMLSLGVIDGRNVWRADLERALDLVLEASDALGSDRVIMAPSCSLLHVPVDLDSERSPDGEVRGWMAFARQKLDEVVLLARAAAGGSAEVTELLAENRRLLERRRSSARVANGATRQRTAAVEPKMMRRRSSLSARRVRQSAVIPLPLLPTTTIGSLPQTSDIRRMRAALRSGDITRAEYTRLMQAEIRSAIRFQEQIGLDVFVHGEFERNDMVEYFAEQLGGFAFTSDGWVQSYGTRCVKPPVLFGDIVRSTPMSVALSRYAQSLTSAPVKGMLTGPVTMLQWSFVRDDLPREEVCRQLALVLRDEVSALEAAGIRIIQVDEPALREGLPLRRTDRADYLRWAVSAFRLATGGAEDTTQIHTHMCYSEFGEILPAIREMDADVVSIEAARSGMELLSQLRGTDFESDIGPGVWDIHSPRVPDASEIETLIRKALRVVRPEQLWINPDCGLKTRNWDEVRAALANLLKAVVRVREDLACSAGEREGAGDTPLDVRESERTVSIGMY